MKTLRQEMAEYDSKLLKKWQDWDGDKRMNRMKLQVVENTCKYIKEMMSIKWKKK